MGWRFYRRARIAPGVRLNWSRSGPSLTVGVRGAHVTFGKRGITRTVGLPGTGVFYTTRDGWHSGAHTQGLAPAPAAVAQAPAEAPQRRMGVWTALFVVALMVLAAWLYGSGVWF
jgi:Protein of unknown function (DUF4236)